MNKKRFSKNSVYVWNSKFFFTNIIFEKILILDKNNVFVIEKSILEKYSD